MLSAGNAPAFPPYQEGVLLLNYESLKSLSQQNLVLGNILFVHQVEKQM